MCPARICSGGLRRIESMETNGRLDTLLDGIGGDAPNGMPDDFMGAVWEKAGYLAARRDRRKRSALFAVVAVVGFGTGVGTVQVPADADHTEFVLSDGAGLSPASLLHVSR